MKKKALPISPFTGEPYDPSWGTRIQKGGGRTGEKIVKREIERKERDVRKSDRRGRSDES